MCDRLRPRARAIAIDDDHGGRLVLQHPDGTRAQLVDAPGEAILAVRCDASVQHVLYVRGKLQATPPRDDLFVVDRAGQVRQLTTGHHTSTAGFTPDGRSIVFSAAPDGKPYLYEIATIGTVRKLSARQGVLRTMVASADGRLVVADRELTAGVEVVTIDTRGGGERVLAPGSRPFLSWDEHRVLFASTDQPARLEAIALDGGAVESVATLPGPLIDGTSAPDGVHLEIRRDGRDTWWRVVDGRLVPDDVQGLVFAAPRGGWRAVRTRDDGYRYRLLAPEGAASPHECRTEAARVTWLDERRFAYASKGAFHVVDAPTGDEVATVPAPKWDELAVLTSDGVHCIDLEAVAHVTRHVLANFGDRPWRD